MKLISSHFFLFFREKEKPDLRVLLKACNNRIAIMEGNLINTTGLYYYM